MCPFVSADVRGGGRLRDEPKECLRRRLSNCGSFREFQSLRNVSGCTVPLSNPRELTGSPAMD